MLLKNQWVNKEIKEEIKKKNTLTNDRESTVIQNLGMQQKYKEVQSNIDLPQKNKKNLK